MKLRNYLKNYEEKDVQEKQFKKMLKRTSLENSLGMKKSLRAIGIGVGFAISLTLFEFGMKSPQVGDILQIIFRIGFFISMFGVLYVPYGLYHFIKSFTLKK